MLDARPSFASVAAAIGDPQQEAVLAECAQQVKDEIHNANFDLKRAKARDDLNRLIAEGRRYSAALSRAWEHVLDFPTEIDEVWTDARKAITEVDALSLVNRI